MEAQVKENKATPRPDVAPVATTASANTDLIATAPGGYKVIRRNGKVTPYDASKIKVALTKAFLAVEGGSAAESGRVHRTVATLTEQVTQAVTRNQRGGGTVHIEDIQDQVELTLMRGGEQKVARAYVLYREEQSRKRAEKAALDAAENRAEASQPTLNVKHNDGSSRPLDEDRLRRLIIEACEGISSVHADQVINDTLRNLYDGISEAELAQAPTLAARTLIEREPNSRARAREKPSAPALVAA